MASSQNSFATASSKTGTITKRKRRHGMSLARRRLVARMRRVASALLAGLAVFSALQCVMATVRTQPMLVTTTHVSRGERLQAAHLSTISVPVHSSFAQAPMTPEDVESAIALVDMPAGTLILASHIRGRPVPPDGSTVIETLLASHPDGMDAGDTVDVIAGQSCPAIGYADAEPAAADTQPSADEPAPSPDPPDSTPDQHSTSGQQCVIASRATVITVPSDDAPPGVDSKTSIAMRPQEALALMRLPDGLPVIAARSQTPSAPQPSPVPQTRQPS